MKKLIPLITGALAFSSAFGQSFTDDFESYAVGLDIGTTSDWTTWSGIGGGADDVPVSDANAYSGSNSLHFLATGSGGPGDIVKPFGSEISTGAMDFEMWMYVEQNKVAYFNFQKENTVGNTWALDCMFDQGNLTMYNSSDTYIDVSYPQATWFKLEMSLALNSNSWEVFIDGSSVGSFSNAENQIASMNIYSIQNADFYIDDISYTITPYTLPATNAGLTYLTPNAELESQVSHPSVKLRNLGVGTINDVELTVDYNGSQYTENFNSLALTSLDEATLDLSTSFPLVSGSNNLTVSITDVNGFGSDDDATDDSQTITIDPISVYPGRMVLGEEATGTWCGWCPRGAVAMDEMEIAYHDFWAGVAVHNGDPMTDSDYDGAIGTLISGYPSGIVDRGSDIDPSNMRQDFLTRISTAPAALIEMGAEYNTTTRELKMSATAEFLEAVGAGYKLAIILTEDDVTGTGSGYAQANYYASQGIDLMDPAGFNWADLSSNVPAADMVYNHVARGIFPSFGGQVNSVPATVAIGEMHTLNATITLDQEWDHTKLKLIGVLIEPNGDANNAGKATLADAETNGYVLSTDTYSFNYAEDLFEVYPNPATNNATIALNFNEKATVTIYDIAGKVVQSTELSKKENEISLVDFASGMYTVEVSSENKIDTKKLIVK